MIEQLMRHKVLRGRRIRKRTHEKGEYQRGVLITEG
jgi:hypothetical protein